MFNDTIKKIKQITGYVILSFHLSLTLNHRLHLVMSGVFFLVPGYQVKLSFSTQGLLGVRETVFVLLNSRFYLFLFKRRSHNTSNTVYTR
jgi:hypothetical protein